VNEPAVISETIDGETVIINLTTGSYYSLKHSAAVIWSGIQQSSRLSDIAAIVRASFKVGNARVEVEIASYIDRLVEEGLVRLSTNAHPRQEVDIVRPRLSTERFSPPVFEKFTDMEAMLLLDPVHDVDDEGWPHMPKPDA
jgi:hypothetical protein